MLELDLGKTKNISRDANSTKREWNIISFSCGTLCFVNIQGVPQNIIAVKIQGVPRNIIAKRRLGSCLLTAVFRGTPFINLYMSVQV